MKRDNFLFVKSVAHTAKISNELYSKIGQVLQAGLLTMPLYCKTTWIHLRDAVECGTISPMEAYECLQAGYVFEHLKVRKSNYSHLL